LFIFFLITVLFSYVAYVFSSIHSFVLIFESLPFRGEAISHILHVCSLTCSNIHCLSSSLTHIGKCVKGHVHNGKIIVGFSLVAPPLQKTLGYLSKKLTRAQVQNSVSK